MLVALTAALLLNPAAQGTQTTHQRTRITRTVTWRDPVERITVNAGERVRIVLTNPDSRAWTALRPITRTIALVSSNSRDGASTFEYTTSAAARPNLEFRHPSGRTRVVKLTIVAPNTRNSQARPGNKIIVSKAAPPIPVGARVRYVFGEDQADKMVTVPRGELFEIRLPENPSTGYVWRAEPWPTDVLALKSSTYVADPIERGVVGSGGTRVIRLKAIARGTGDIDLVYERPNAPKEDPRTFHLVLNVR